MEFENIDRVIFEEKDCDTTRCNRAGTWNNIIKNGFLLMILFLIFLSCSTGNKKEFTDGLYVTKYPNGNVFIKGLVLNGNKNGVWKVYDKDGNLLKAYHFFKGKKLFDIDIDDYNLDTKFFNSELTIKLPKEWIFKEDIEKQAITAVKPQSNDSVLSPSFNITKSIIPEGKTFDDIEEISINELKSFFPDFKLKEKKFDKIADLDCFVFIYLVKYNKKTLAVYSFYYKSGKDVYLLTCMSEGSEFLKYKDLFEEISKTIELTQN